MLNTELINALIEIQEALHEGMVDDRKLRLLRYSNY